MEGEEKRPESHMHPRFGANSPVFRFVGERMEWGGALSIIIVWIKGRALQILNGKGVLKRWRL